MPLIIITGLPCSGKSYRSQQIAAGVRDIIDGDASRSKTTVQIIGSYHASSDPSGDVTKTSDSETLRDEIYNHAAREKTARAAEFSAVKRALSKDNIVITDALNYIKGYRYQLWCEAKAAETRCCVVHVAAQEAECEQWNRERLRAWKAQDGQTEPVESATQPAKTQPKDIFGDLVPQSHTAVYGDRRAEQSTVSPSSSLDAFPHQANRPPSAPSGDVMTLKSLYIGDGGVQDRPAAAEVSLPEDSSTTPTPQAVMEPPSSTSAPPYSASTLQSLVMRYEPPSPFSRWDTPLFTVPTADACPPVHDIWKALFPTASKPISPKALSQMSPMKPVSAHPELVRPHAATVLPKATASDALQILETATMDVTKHLLTAAREQGVADLGEGGTLVLSIPVSATESREGNGAPSDAPAVPSEIYETSVTIPPDLALSQPLLQRLRRKYTQIQRGSIAHGQGYVQGRLGVLEGFVAFLDSEWNPQDRDR